MQRGEDLSKAGLQAKLVAARTGHSGDLLRMGVTAAPIDSTFQTDWKCVSLSMAKLLHGQLNGRGARSEARRAAHSRRVGGTKGRFRL